jgi:hypothetical protein
MKGRQNFPGPASVHPINCFRVRWTLPVAFPLIRVSVIHSLEAHDNSRGEAFVMEKCAGLENIPPRNVLNRDGEILIDGRNRLRARECCARLPQAQRREPGGAHHVREYGQTRSRADQLSNGPSDRGERNVPVKLRLARCATKSPRRFANIVAKPSPDGSNVRMWRHGAATPNHDENQCPSQDRKALILSVSPSCFGVGNHRDQERRINVRNPS